MKNIFKEKTFQFVDVLGSKTDFNFGDCFLAEFPKRGNDSARRLGTSGYDTYK